MIDKQQLEKFRAELVRQRDQVMGEMAEHKPLVDTQSSVEDKADRVASQLVETRISENDGNLLQKIEFALERIAAGTYQHCDHCGEEIPVARLEAKPSASLCVSCQEKKDTGQLPSS